MNGKRSSVIVTGADEKKPRKSLSLELKLEVLRRIEKGERQVDICNAFSLAGSTVRTIIKNKEKIEEYGRLSSPLASVRFVKNRSPLMIEMERLLGVWIEDQTRRHLPVSSLLIQEKAKSLYETLKVKAPGSADTEPFKASAGWFERFKRRANLHITALQGEAGSSDEASSRSKPHVKLESDSGKEDDESCESKLLNSSVNDDIIFTPKNCSLLHVKHESDVEKYDTDLKESEPVAPLFNSENKKLQKSGGWGVQCAKHEQSSVNINPKQTSPGTRVQQLRLENEIPKPRPKHRSKASIRGEPDSVKDELPIYSESIVPSFSLENDKPLQRRKYIRKTDAPYFSRESFCLAEARMLGDHEETNIDEDKLFLLSLLPPLKRLPPDVKSSVKLKFQQIMHETSYGELQLSPYYNHSPPCSPYAVSVYAQTPIPEVIIHNSNPSHSESSQPSPTASLT